MTVCLAPDLKEMFRRKEPSVMMDAIKTHFGDELKREKFRQLRMFQTIHMEEHTCLKTHLKRLYGIYFQLTLSSITGWQIPVPFGLSWYLYLLAMRSCAQVHFESRRYELLQVRTWVPVSEGWFHRRRDLRCYRYIFDICRIMNSPMEYDEILIIALFVKQVLIITYMRRSLIWPGAEAGSQGVDGLLVFTSSSYHSYH